MNNKIYPFKFLDSYTAEDKDIFFGRDEEVDQLYEMIYQSDILLLYGASGTGKTSLIQCGLASKFEEHDWLEIFVRRNKNLNESLDKSLIAVGGEQEADKSLGWLNNLMEDEEANVSTKKMSKTQVYLKSIYLKHFRPIYLIFDQFEELFILGSKKEQAQFIATVQELLNVEQPVKLIFSIREEYLGSLYEFEKAVPELFRKKLRIDPMNLGKVKDVVLGATKSKQSIVHINEEEGNAIAEQVFEKIRGEEKSLTIQLPYLQVFLDKFYRHISKDKSKKPTTEATFNLKALGEIGDIGDILRDFLDEQIVEIANSQKCERKTIWKTLSPFVTIDGTKEPIGLDTLGHNFPDIPKSLIEQVVTALMNNRILRYIEEEELYEIAHDSLALRIAEKRSDDEIALLEVRNLIKSQSLLKDEARELFSKKQLGFISPFLKRLKLNLEETTLIEESKVEILRVEKKATRRKLGLTIVIILVILIGFFIKEKLTYEAAEKEKVEKERREKIINAMDFYDGKYALAFKNGEYGFINKKGETVINYEYNKGEPFNLHTGFAEMEIGSWNSAEEKYLGTKYLVDTSGNRYRLIYISEVLKNRSNVKSTLSKEDIRWLRKKLRKGKNQKKILNKLEQISDGIELEIKELVGILNQDGEKLALDFSGLTQIDILNVLDTIVTVEGLKDKVELLFFQGTDLDVFPASISRFKNLREVDISFTAISKLPLSFNKLVHLVKLDLSGTEISSIPETIGKLVNLKKLILPIGLKKLPANIYELAKLEELNLYGAEVSSIPETIGNLVNLRKLILPVGLKKLSANIYELVKLEELDLSGTEIGSIPETIGNLVNLRVLSLPRGLKKLPASIYELAKLEELDLYGAEVSSIPETIGNLVNLRKLILPVGLKKLPANIYELAKLEELNLLETEIGSIPEAIGNLVNLRVLSLPRGLEKIPDISKLKKLYFFSYTLRRNKNYTSNLAKLEALQKEFSNCNFEITDEDEEVIELLKSNN